jgi:hypothetical protein
MAIGILSAHQKNSQHSDFKKKPNRIKVNGIDIKSQIRTTLFSLQITNGPNKLECLQLARLSVANIIKLF